MSECSNQINTAFLKLLFYAFKVFFSKLRTFIMEIIRVIAETKSSQQVFNISIIMFS